MNLVVLQVINLILIVRLFLKPQFLLMNLAVLQVMNFCSSIIFKRVGPERAHA